MVVLMEVVGSGDTGDGWVLKVLVLGAVDGAGNVFY